MTALSRVFGLARDVAMATTFGLSALADAFFIAFRLPNVFRRLFAEGAFSQAFTPLFAPMLRQNQTRARVFAWWVLTFLAGVVAFFVLVLMLFADVGLAVVAPGLSPQESTYHVTAELLTIMLPLLWCMSVVSWQAAVLYTHHVFALPSAAPIVLNGSMLSALALAWYGGWSTHDAVFALAWGVVIGGVLQVLLLVWPVLRRLSAPRARGESRNVYTLRDVAPDVWRMVRLALPSSLAAGVYQINVLVNTMFATLLPAGSVAVLYYADRVSQLPLGIIGVAVGTVVLPRLSAEAHNRDEHHRTALFYALLLGVPAAVGLWLLALPIMRVLFVHGGFTYEDGQAAAQTLRAFAVGVPAFVLVRVVVAFFYARQAHLVPMRAALMALLVNVGAALALMPTWGFVGLALAIVCAGWSQLIVLLVVLCRRGWLTLKGLPVLMGKISIACLAMAGMLEVVSQFQPMPSQAWSNWALFLTGGVIGGIIVYSVVCGLLGIRLKHEEQS